MTVVFLVLILGTQLFSLAPPAGVSELGQVAGRAANIEQELVSKLNNHRPVITAKKLTEIQKVGSAEINAACDNLGINSREARETVAAFISEFTKDKELMCKRYDTLLKYLATQVGDDDVRADVRIKNHLAILKANQKWVNVSRGIEGGVVVLCDTSVPESGAALESLILLGSFFQRYNSDEFGKYFLKANNEGPSEQAAEKQYDAQGGIFSEDIMSFLSGKMPTGIIDQLDALELHKADTVITEGMSPLQNSVIRVLEIQLRTAGADDFAEDGPPQVTAREYVLAQESDHYLNSWRQGAATLRAYNNVVLAAELASKAAYTRLERVKGDIYAGGLTFSKAAAAIEADILTANTTAVSSAVTVTSSASILGTATGESQEDYNSIKDDLKLVYSSNSAAMVDIQKLVVRIALNNFRKGLLTAIKEAPPVFRDTTGREVRVIGKSRVPVVVLQEAQDKAYVGALEDALTDPCFSSCGYTEPQVQEKRGFLSKLRSKKKTEEVGGFLVKSSEYRTIVKEDGEVMIPCASVLGSTVSLQSIIEEYLVFIDSCQNAEALSKATEAMKQIFKIVDGFNFKNTDVPDTLVSANSIRISVTANQEDVTVRRSGLGFDKKFGGVSFGVVLVPDAQKMVSGQVSNLRARVPLTKYTNPLQGALRAAIMMAESRCELAQTSAGSATATNDGSAVGFRGISKKHGEALVAEMNKLRSRINPVALEQVDKMVKDLVNGAGDIRQREVRVPRAELCIKLQCEPDTLAIVNAIISRLIRAQAVACQNIEELRMWLHMRLMTSVEFEGVKYYSNTKDFKASSTTRVRGLARLKQVFNNAFTVNDEAVKRALYTVLSAAAGVEVPQTLRSEESLNEKALLARSPKAALPSSTRTDFVNLKLQAPRHVVQMTSELSYRKFERNDNFQVRKVNKSTVELVVNSKDTDSGGKEVEGVLFKSLHINKALRALRVLFPGQVLQLLVPVIVQTEAGAEEQPDQSGVGRSRGVAKLGFVKDKQAGGVDNPLAVTYYNDSGTLSDKQVAKLKETAQRTREATTTTASAEDGNGTRPVVSEFEHKLEVGLGATLRMIANSWTYEKGGTDRYAGYSTLAFAQFQVQPEGTGTNVKLESDTTMELETVSGHVGILPALHENMQVSGEVGLVRQEDLIRSSSNWLSNPGSAPGVREGVQGQLRSELENLVAEGLVKVDLLGNVYAIESSAAELLELYATLMKDDNPMLQVRKVLVAQLVTHLNYVSLKKTLCVLELYRKWFMKREADLFAAEGQPAWVDQMKGTFDRLKTQFDAMQKLRVGAVNNVNGITAGTNESSRAMEALFNDVQGIFAQLTQHTFSSEAAAGSTPEHGTQKAILTRTVITKGEPLTKVQAQSLTMVSGILSDVGDGYKRDVSADVTGTEMDYALNQAEIVTMTFAAEPAATATAKVNIAGPFKAVSGAVIQHIGSAGQKAVLSATKAIGPFNKAKVQLVKILEKVQENPGWDGMEDDAREAFWNSLADKTREDVVKNLLKAPVVQTYYKAKKAALVEEDRMRNVVAEMLLSLVEKSVVDGIGDLRGAITGFRDGGQTTLPLGVTLREGSETVSDQFVQEAFTFVSDKIEAVQDVVEATELLRAHGLSVVFACDSTVDYVAGKVSSATSWEQSGKTIKVKISQELMKNMVVNCTQGGLVNAAGLDVYKAVIQALLAQELIQATINILDRSVIGEAAGNQMRMRSMQLMQGLASGTVHGATSQQIKELIRTDFTGLCYLSDGQFAAFSDGLHLLAELGVANESLTVYRDEILRKTREWRQDQAGPMSIKSLTPGEISQVEYPVHSLDVIQHA